MYAKTMLTVIVAAGVAAATAATRTRLRRAAEDHARESELTEWAHAAMRP